VFLHSSQGQFANRRCASDLAKSCWSSGPNLLLCHRGRWKKTWCQSQWIRTERWNSLHYRLSSFHWHFAHLFDGLSHCHWRHAHGPWHRPTHDCLWDLGWENSTSNYGYAGYDWNDGTNVLQLVLSYSNILHVALNIDSNTLNSIANLLLFDFHLIVEPFDVEKWHFLWSLPRRNWLIDTCSIIASLTTVLSTVVIEATVSSLWLLLPSTLPVVVILHRNWNWNELPLWL